MPTPPDIAGLSRALKPIIGVPGRIDALPFGTTGHSYLIEAASGCFVAKVFAEDSAALLGPAEQFDLMRALADTGIAPTPVGFEPDARILVTAFLDGAIPLDQRSLRRPENIAKVVECLRKLHVATAEIPGFAPRDCARRYVGKAGGLMSLSESDRERYAELRDLASILDGLPVTVCHNDLLAANMLVKGEIRLVDFDYAVKAPPIVDLASVVVMNGLPEREALDLLGAYFGARTPDSDTEFARVQRLVRLVAHFWALASGDARAAIVAKYRMRDG